MTDHQGRIKVLNVKRTSGNDFWSKNKHERLLWLQTMKAHAETGVWGEKHRVVLHAVKNVVINHVCFVQYKYSASIYSNCGVLGFGSSQQLSVPCEITR